MVYCINVACFFCTVCGFIGLGSLLQFCLGLYLTFIQTDIVTINRLIKTDKFDSYLTYVLLAFISLGFISLLLAFISIYGTIKKNRPLSLFVAILWIFAFTLNFIILGILLVYYYFILSQLSPTLINVLRQSPSTTTDLLDILQYRYKCCGIHNNDDYKNLSLDSLPSSCCRVPNCWHSVDMNNNGTNITATLMHTSGCYPTIEKYLTIELWILTGVAGFCAVLQILAIALLCVLNQRYKKLDDIPKFIINHLATGVPINSNNNIHGLSKNIEETIEITQI